jgi:peroxiredoxin
VKLARRKSELDALGVSLVAISADDAADSQALRERLGLNFPLLSDPDVVVATAYGVAMRGQDIAIPATILVLPNREVFWKYVGENPSDRPPEVVLFEQLEVALARL